MFATPLEIIFPLAQTTMISCAIILVIGYIDKWVRNRKKLDV